jgi:predicted MFS family arabinose efflux permease
MFVWHAIRNHVGALIDLRIFRNGVFSIATMAQFFSQWGELRGASALFLIAGCGTSPAKAGWMLAPTGLGLISVNSMLGYLTERFNCRAVSVGGTIVAILSTLFFLWMTQHQMSPILVAACSFARGAGQGAVFLPSIAAAYASVPRHQLAPAATASNIVQRLGGPIGTTIMAVILSRSDTYVPAGRP